ncbi:MAG: two-component system response regulator CreB [Desulfobacterales bacterium]|nr:two-component system response regulator CreB [Desulfobacterales bacterium]
MGFRKLFTTCFTTFLCNYRVKRDILMKPKILIVEDETAIVDNIQFALETEGFQTIWHSEGKEVLPLLIQDKIDLIVLDIGLPDINGMELCKEIRKTKTTPIIFLTARSDEIDRIVGLEIGADDYMVKPFSPRELSARVKAILRRTMNNLDVKTEVLESSPFKVDEDRNRMTYFKQKLDLSRYEFKILQMFINRPGRIYSREQLMENIWDEPEMSMDRTVDTHIKNIRNKLKVVAPEIDPILTHRSLGYSLKEDI